MQGSARLGRVMGGGDSGNVDRVEEWRNSGFWFIVGKGGNWFPWACVAEHLQQHLLFALAKQGTRLN